MSCAASPQPPRPPPAAPSAAALAPGFRFHPTDEELVSYYLKRKVAGRTFRVDAISEIDLYRSEPWDLPGKSRIQSRDMEWYFFSALDRKYANRSRTNRATGSGYWKTTGKDRPVCRAGRTVGMKKTLVYHVGRAPKGQRTNWVMHEYRLEDEELARAGISQDAFVVCRIFQKRGPGPQNGAQYGAPFVEEEWEEDVLPVLKEEDGEDPLDVVVGNSVPTEMDDHEEIEDMGVRNENTASLVEHGEQDDFNDFIDLDGVFEICENQVVGNDESENIEVPGQLNDQTLVGPGIDSDTVDQNQSYPVLNDEFMELNDFAYPIGTNSQEDDICPGEVYNDATFVSGEIFSQPELHHKREIFNADNENSDLSGAFPPSQTVQNNYFLELDDLLGPEIGHYSSGEPDDDGMPYFDAPTRDLDAVHGSSADMTNFMDSTIDNSSGPDLVDELIAYFDATENMQSADLDLKGEADVSSQADLALVKEENAQAYQTSPQPSNIDGGNNSSSLMPNTDMHSRFKNVDIHGESDTPDDSTWDKVISKRLVNLLGSISSPPAYAAEFPMKQPKSIEQNSAAHSSSPMHIAAGMIQIHGGTMSVTGKNWSTLKKRDAGFLLSYGMMSYEAGNSAGFDTPPKMPSGITSFMLRNSFHLLFLSVLFLAASFKIWVCVYGK